MTNSPNYQKAAPQILVARRPLNRIGSARPLAVSPTTVGERMVHRRLALGLTQAQVSTQVRLQTKNGRTGSGRSLSRNTYCMYETGKYEPRLGVIEQIAVALAVSPGWLAFGTKDLVNAASTLPAGIASLSISFRWSGLAVLTHGVENG